MKTGKIIVRVSLDDKKIIQQAVRKYHIETGVKHNISAMVRHVVKEYVGKTSECLK